MFKEIDGIIDRWAEDNGLKWYRLYKGEEVRSIEVALTGGSSAQIWLERRTDGKWKVLAWDRRKRKISNIADKAGLEQCLADTLSTVRAW